MRCRLQNGNELFRPVPYMVTVISSQGSFPENDRGLSDLPHEPQSQQKDKWSADPNCSAGLDQAPCNLQPIAHSTQKDLAQSASFLDVSMEGKKKKEETLRNCSSCSLNVREWGVRTRLAPFDLEFIDFREVKRGVLLNMSLWNGFFSTRMGEREASHVDPGREEVSRRLEQIRPSRTAIF